MFEWYMASLVVKSDCPVDTFYDETEFAQKRESTILGSMIVNTIWKTHVNTQKRRESSL